MCEPIVVKDSHAFSAPSDHTVVAKLLQTTVHMNHRQADSIRELMLGQRHGERAAAVLLIRVELLRHLAQEIGDALKSVALADIQQPVSKHRSILLMRKHQGPPDPRPTGDKAVQFGHWNGRHVGIAQSADAVITSVRNRELRVAHFPRHQISEDLTTAIRKQLVTDGHASQDHVNDSKLRILAYQRGVRRNCPTVLTKMFKILNLFIGKLGVLLKP